MPGFGVMLIRFASFRIAVCMLIEDMDTYSFCDSSLIVMELCISSFRISSRMGDESAFATWLVRSISLRL